MKKAIELSHVSFVILPVKIIRTYSLTHLPFKFNSDILKNL